MENMQTVEFIELYHKGDDGDYKWIDNHGQLIRCENCKHRGESKDGLYCKTYLIFKDPEGFCDKGEKGKPNEL